MKKLIILVLFVLLCISVAGCAEKIDDAKGPEPDIKQEENEDLPVADKKPEENEPENAEPSSYAFSVQYIRTDGYHEDAEYPVVTVIDSRAELMEYYEKNKKRHDLERREKVYSDTTIGFLDACDKYDDGYFEDRNLVLILLEEGSGSIRHEITDVRNDGGWEITCRRIVPEVGTDDMAEWHIFLEVQMGKVITKDDAVKVRFTC